MDITSMEPMVPEERIRSLDDDAVTLISEAGQLAASMRPLVREAVGDLVRSMNCYYSNLIEGHDTHPRSIDQAMANEFSTEPKQRDLQKEAIAHIHVQKLIDDGNDPDTWPASAAYASWLHKEFCSHLPSEMLWITDGKTGQRLPVEPGAWRVNDVKVGRHLPPEHDDLPRFMTRFDRAYGAPPLNRLRQIQTVGAVHHRFLWIHPFLDGNGRVARLMSHSLLKRLGIGTSLWAVSRGLARDVKLYKDMLAQADAPREGDRDGRGNLTQRGLVDFCKYFLDKSIDQIRFMEQLLEPATLLDRIEIHMEEEIRAKRLPKGSFAVLREALNAGEVERGKVPSLTNYEERAARAITSALVDRGMLTATSHRAPLRIAFSADVAERWFPSLYPNNAGAGGS